MLRLREYGLKPLRGEPEKDQVQRRAHSLFLQLLELELWSGIRGNQSMLPLVKTLFSLLHKQMIFFPLQKKAEEAHKIFEGLGPKVELVSSLAAFSLFFMLLS